ncbi:hypothetical protein BJY16_007577 [Actinoplanes octamycinicus]|uniref:Uncharacterized protein n=1 Tax=Actinoplanes octamycinicus TaxID=135948 RepID=A0A7W7H508_9ACTN|nr:hypothetical protein [Actinoplanes octamycinicus]MBB4744118.1 hypothetical protein [Actinoplanes octamycinicus]GIE56925.1 hypothetical protein Aoc01nite_23270 [Actinoplanes octamycinicus]
METKSEADVNALVQQHAEQMATTVGMPLFNAKLNASPCTGRLGEDSDTIFTVQGAYNVVPPQKDQHLASLDKVKADWTAKGYTITDDRTVGPDDGVVAAKTPDGFNLDIERANPSGFVILIHSPCYERP